MAKVKLRKLPIKKDEMKVPEAPLIKPLIRAGDEKHVLEEIYSGSPDEMPILKSVGYMRVAGVKNGWISYKLETKGAKVLSIEVSEPDMRLIAEENAKTDFVTMFIDQETF